MRVASGTTDAFPLGMGKLISTLGQLGLAIALAASVWVIGELHEVFARAAAGRGRTRAQRPAPALPKPLTAFFTSGGL
jgi:hypothetical protein